MPKSRVKCRKWKGIRGKERAVKRSDEKSQLKIASVTHSPLTYKQRDG